jgi:hypothetical protein
MGQRMASTARQVGRDAWTQRGQIARQVGSDVAQQTFSSIGKGQRSWQGPNREVFGGIDPNYNWRQFELRPLQTGGTVEDRLSKLEKSKPMSEVGQVTTQPTRSRTSGITATPSATTTTTMTGPQSDLYSRGRPALFQEGVGAGTGTPIQPPAAIGELPGLAPVMQQMQQEANVRRRQSAFKSGLGPRQSSFYAQMTTPNS